MPTTALAVPRISQVPQPSAYADFLFDGLKRSGCIKDRASAWRWLSLRTRDNAQANRFLDALFPND